MTNPKDIFELLDEAKQAGLSETEVFWRVGQFLELKARAEDVPYFGHFELTPLCNLDCKMCYVHLDRNQMAGNDLLSADTWIDLMRQAIDNGMASAALTGGECLTYPRFDEIFLFLKSNGIRTTVLTNGVLLDQARIAFFKQHLPAMIQVSLYGNSEEAYEQVTGKCVFSRVLENIRAAREANLPLRIAITPSRHMMKYVKATMRLAQDLDVPFSVNSTLSTPRTSTGRELLDSCLSIEENLEILKYRAFLRNVVPEPSKIPPFEWGRETEYTCTGLKCGAGKSGFSISWDGSMHPCIQFGSIASYPIESGFLSAWMHINQEVKRYPCFTKCMECNYVSVCGFCASENEKLGSRNVLNPIWCETVLKRAEYGVLQFQDKCEQKQ